MTDSKSMTEPVLEFCRTLRSRSELEQFMGFTRYYTMKEIVNPLVESGELSLTIPDKPKSKNQKYFTSK